MRWSGPTTTHSIVFDAEAVTHVAATGFAALEELIDTASP
jgi:hypothetical protein